MKQKKSAIGLIVLAFICLILITGSPFQIANNLVENNGHLNYKNIGQEAYAADDDDDDGGDDGDGGDDSNNESSSGFVALNKLTYSTASDNIISSHLFTRTGNFSFTLSSSFRL